ncbi:8-oxoguanine deaminase [Antarctobacter heliothermus]|uniref:8-oxoguanine deaminase n=1 Tax=Antarctobacter heliothermus TaxID=74033 RepID=A0A222E1G8_9RHOB|nr:amidohydrolase family protein [Antarctobacter heliothermus]ASP20036.1 8-oxoguanine deaminase [Antarctobacter heliothermus]
MTETLVTADRILVGFGPDHTPDLREDAALLIRDGKVAAIGPAETLRRDHPDAERIGGSGQVVIPGLINAHHHVGLTPFQLGVPDLPLELWIAARIGLREVAPRLDTLFSAFEMIASGVTTVQHLHARAPGTPEGVLGRADEILSAYAEIGMRVSYSFALRDQNRLVYAADQDFVATLPEPLRAPTAEYLGAFALPLSDQVAIFDALRSRYAGDPMTAIQIGPSNLHWLSDAALESAAEMSGRTGAPMHIHLLETPYQVEYARQRTGGSAVAHLDRFGLLGPQTTLGHAVWMTADDIALCAERGVCLCHNCSSNLRLKSGTADLNGFLASGVPVAMGIDEAGINDDRDMMQEMRLVQTLHRPSGHSSPTPSAAQVLQMATEYGAATTPFADRVGRLEVGCEADLVLLDWARLTYPWQDPARPFAEVLVRRARPEFVLQVLIGGRSVLKDGRFVNVDRDQILDEIAASLGRSPQICEQSRVQLAADLFPHVDKFYANW